MSKENKLISELRFPEFVCEGEWDSRKLYEIADLKNGYAFLSSTYDENGTYGIVTIANVQQGHLKLNPINKIKQLPIDIQPHHILKKGEIVISMTGNVGRTCKIDVEGLLLNQRVGKIIPTRVNSEFLFQALQLSRYFKDLQSKAVGGAQGNLSSSDINDSIILISKSIQEQQKIAFCLSSLDEVIVAHSQKLELLKDHKTGLMQNLFPQEGHKVPKYRFKEFENDGEWIEKKLGNVATFLKGKGISKADIIENGNLPCIRYGELYTHYTETISTIKSYTNSSADDLILSEANDVIIPASGETQIDIATASCVLENGIALGGDLNIIRSKINGVFLSYYLNNAKKKEIAQMAQGIAVVHLYPNQLKTLVIQIPKPNEQQKIASCLSALDELMTAQTERIEQLKLHKKGLMQGLFPKIDN